MAELRWAKQCLVATTIVANPLVLVDGKSMFTRDITSLRGQGPLRLNRHRVGLWRSSVSWSEGGEPCQQSTRGSNDSVRV